LFKPENKSLFFLLVEFFNVVVAVVVNFGFRAPFNRTDSTLQIVSAPVASGTAVSSLEML
jgi:hypothetical protein